MNIFKKAKLFISNFTFCLNLLFNSSKKTTIFLLLINAFISALPFVGLYITKYLTDNLLEVIVNKNTEEILVKIVFILIIFAVVKILVSFLQNYISKINDLQVQQLLSYINIELMKKSVKIDISYFDIPSNFDDLNKSRQNAHSLHQIVYATSNALMSTFAFITNIVLAVKVSVFMSIVVCICVLPKFIFKFHVEKNTYQFEKKQFRKSRYASYIYSLLFDKPAAKEMRLFNVGNYFIEKYVKVQSDLTEEENHFVNKNSFRNILLGVPEIIIQIIIKIIVAYKIIFRNLTLGDFTYISGIFENLSSSGTSLVNSVSVFVGYNERINDFKHYFMNRESLVRNGNRTLETIESILFKDVCFSYPDSELVLKNISFEIKNKEKCMLIGLNGSGKTTIIKLLTRFYEPQQGDIFINNIPICEYDIDSLRSNIAIVFQDFNIFSFTLRDNIAIGDYKKVDEDLLLETALMISHFNNAEYLMNKNLDMYLNKNFEESGIELSGGQQQKIAIARAFIRNSKLLILDEPTASLDPISEGEILDVYNQFYESKTLLMVSHRLSAAIKMDKIIFIENGKVKNIGTHKELYANDTLYKEMFDLQADKYKE